MRRRSDREQEEIKKISPRLALVVPLLSLSLPAPSQQLGGNTGIVKLAFVVSVSLCRLCP
jgi:hypothetical protein